MLKSIIAIIVLFTFSLSAQAPLPNVQTSMFAGSGNCAICHSSDGVNVLTHNGQDISMVTAWRSTMMGNSSKDPLWRAMVSEETNRFPMLKNTIENTCTRCHAPVGYTESERAGNEFYTMDSLRVSTFANDGVNCTVCHQIKPENFGQQASYSGHYKIDTTRIIYGPYQNPLAQPMISMSNFTPVFATHMNSSELCATCHTLFTPYLDNNNQIAGTFPEQTPYLEWKNSVYNGTSTNCQSCHMPIITDSIDIATIPAWHVVKRAPFRKHDFVGGNYYMLEMMKNNIDSLGLTATAAQITGTQEKALQNLRNGISLSATSEIIGDTIEITVVIQNLTGHKIPSGIPTRRMWINLQAKDHLGNVMFDNGRYNSEGRILGYDSSYEKHYDVINQGDQIQVYEAIIGDVDNERTYTLLRAATYLKDNRIPPVGFTSQHSSYDSTKIYGEALYDPNFNKSGGIEGSGKDVVRYRFARGNAASVTVNTKLLFQTVMWEFADHLTHVPTYDAQKFVQMYHTTPNIPLVAAEKEIQFVVTDVKNEGAPSSFILHQNYPNPFNPETTIRYEIGKESFVNISVFDINANLVDVLVDEHKYPGIYNVKFEPKNLGSGVYFYVLRSGNSTITKKLTLLK